MIEPRRILDDGDDFARALITGARAEHPSARSRRRVASALGIGSAAVLILKWACFAGLAAAAISGATHVVHRGLWFSASPIAVSGGGARNGSPASSPSVALPVVPVAAPAPPPESAAPPAAAALVPHASALARAPAPAAAASSTPAQPSRMLAEAASLDAARVALTGGRPADALRALDDYRTRFPRGALAPEAQVLRIESLDASGDQAGARRLAAAFLRQHPDSPLAARIRKIAASVSNP
jgi:TolA-binding protein